MQDLSKMEQVALALTSAIVSSLPASPEANESAVERYSVILQLLSDKQKAKKPYSG